MNFTKKLHSPGAKHSTSIQNCIIVGLMFSLIKGLFSHLPCPKPSITKCDATLLSDYNKLRDIKIKHVGINV